jgi:hypothetical protein
MVRHWLRTKEPRWQRSVAINAVGAATTGVVLVVIATVKFVHGAWLVIVAVPLLVALMLSIRRHYLSVASQLKRVPIEAVPQPTRILVLVAHHDEGTDRALRYAELLGAEAITCVHAEEPRSDDLIYTWDTAHPGHALEVLPGEKESISQRVVKPTPIRGSPSFWLTGCGSDQSLLHSPIDTASPSSHDCFSSQTWS